MEITKLETEDAAREREAAGVGREGLQAEIDVTRVLAKEYQVKISALEEELARVREELVNEKRQRITERETWERERQEPLERDEAVRNQLGDITNLVQDLCDNYARQKELMDEQWAEKLLRRDEKDSKLQALRDMVIKIIEDREAEKIRVDKGRLANEGIDKELQGQSAEQREPLDRLLEIWRAENARQHKETIEAIQSRSQEQVPFNIHGYLDELSKALASELRMILAEVGKLREERRNIQHELGYLLCIKSKYGPGGEFDSDWKPPINHGGGVGPPPDAPDPLTNVQQAALSGFESSDRERSAS